MFITIFTATYNRKHTLIRLYESLCKQKKKNFEWLIIDDGSTDNTEELVSEFQKKTDSFPILYKKQRNGGKHRAINTAVQMAKGTLFFCVDSDDYLTEDATLSIEEEWKNNKQNIMGLCFRRINPETNEIIGKKFPLRYAFPTTINFVWGIMSDKAEVLRTDIIREVRFPEFDDEYFCTEALWIYLIEKRSHLRMACINQGIRYTKYYEDGLTKNEKRIRKNNPEGYIAYYKLVFLLPSFYLHPKIVLFSIYDFCRLKYLLIKKRYLKYKNGNGFL